MNLNEAVAFLHKNFGNHSQVAKIIGYTPEYYATLRACLLKGKTIPVSAQNRILTHAQLAKITLHIPVSEQANA